MSELFILVRLALVREPFLGSRHVQLLLIGAIIAVQPALVSAQNRTPNRAQRAGSRADTYYADAAGYQNNGAYELAAGRWQKLLTEYPRDPRASKAAHYLGYCYIKLAEQTDEPDYADAISAFQKALSDARSELREESLINLSWCLFNQARESKPGSDEQRAGLQNAKQGFSDYMSQYGGSSYVDQALFYLGEIEYTLGAPSRAISYYKKLLDAKSLAKSKLIPDARYALAVALEEDKQVGQATRQYQTFLREHSQHELVSEVRVRLADLLLAAGKPSEAEELLRDLSRDTQERLADYALLRLGYALEQQDKLEEAARTYETLQTTYPDSKFATTAAMSLGQSLYRAGRSEEAIAQFQKPLAGQDAQAADAAHWIALTYLRQQQPKKAAEILEKALVWSAELPGRVALEMDYADALYAQPDQLAQAQAAYESIAKSHPDDSLAPRAVYNAAFAALQQGKFAEARNWSESFLSKFPQDSLRNDVAYVAAEALLQEGEHEAAAQAYRKLREADPSNQAFPMWTLRLAMANYLAGDYGSATKLLKDEMSTFTVADQKAEAEFIIGASLLYEEQPLAAIKQFEASHRTSQSWNSADEVLLLLAEAQQRNKDDRSAKKTLETLLEKYPNSRLKGQVEYKLAQLSAAMNQFDEAISQYETIVANPEASNLHGFAKYGIAWCLMQQDQYEAALQRLRPLLQAGVTSSISGEIRLAEGICLRKLGRLDEAASALQAWLKSSPSGDDAANGLYELGLAFTEQGNVEAANQQFLRIIEQVPKFPDLDKVLYELAWNYHDSAAPEQAAETFKRLAREFPQSQFSAEAGYMLAQQQYEANQFEQAALTYTSVLKKAKDTELLEKAQYKLGWSLFQQQQYDEAHHEFAEQAKQFPTGPLAVDALFMQAECLFNQDDFDAALSGYRKARGNWEANRRTSAASDQVQTLIYLHGAQCLREQKRWQECQTWLEVVVQRYSDGPYIATALYELAYCKQNSNQTDEALALYEEVATDYRNEIGARAGFMRGEIYFAKRDFVQAIREFQRVMYRFGADKAPADIRNWQVKSAFEAARCTEILLEEPRGIPREKLVQNAQDFYRFIVEKHPAHEMAAQAQNRLGALQKLR